MLSLNDVNISLGKNNLPVINEYEYNFILSSGKTSDFFSAVGDLPAEMAMSYIGNFITRVKQNTKANLAQSNQNTQGGGFSDDGVVEGVQGEPNVFGKSHHAYGKNWAICVTANSTKAGFNTINIEVAKAIGEKRYDWKNKLIVQVTENELPSVVAFCMGNLLNIEHKYHGPNKDKGYSIQNQLNQNGGNYYFKVFAKGIMAQAPVTQSDFFYISRIIFEQMKKNMPNDMSYEAMMAMIRYSYPAFRG